jgi:hypothetical protein
MRRLVTLIVLVGIASAVAGSATAASRPAPAPTLALSATGTVHALDLSRITVGRTTCSFTNRGIASLAGTFAVGESVSISCVRGVLQTIKLASITNGHAKPPVSASVASAASVATSEAASMTNSQSAHGPIVAITATSITVGDVSCPFNVANVHFPQVQVGEVVSISCGTSGLGGSISNIAIP